MALLDIEGLEVRYETAGRRVEAVRGVSLRLEEGECVGIVGESGAGKTQLCLASAGLLPPTARVSGRVRFDGEELLQAPPARLERLRGAALALVFQDPGSALTPHLRIGEQLAEVRTVHRRATRRAAWQAAHAALVRVGFAAPERVLAQFPHELSGGQCQRVLIAMALLGEPRLLIADEPTSALDVTVQAQVLVLLESVRASAGLALLLVSHDIAVVARLAERIVVMYAGRVVESAPTRRLIEAPRHPYSAQLLECVPQARGAPPSRMPFIPGVPPRADVAIAGCAFAPRCARAAERCRRETPPLSGAARAAVACHFPLP